MEETRRKLMELVRSHCRAPSQTTRISGLTLFRSDKPTAPVRSLYTPRICIVLQGSKQIVLDRKTILIRPDEYLVLVLDVPVSACIAEASPSEPHLALTLDLDAAAIAELSMREPLTSGRQETVGAQTSAVTTDILEPFERLMRLLDRPEDIETIGPLILREINYRLLQGSLGNLLRHFCRAGSRLGRIGQTAAWIKNNFHEPVGIDTLADMAGMSITSFHRSFRTATGVSPVQFRNRLRLQEARRRILLGEKTMGKISFDVGYESQSQFNREYRRLFGVSPGEELILRQDTSA